MRTVKNQSQPGTGGEVFRQVTAMVLTGLSLVFCFAGLFQIVETAGRPLNEVDFTGSPNLCVFCSHHSSQCYTAGALAK